MRTLAGALQTAQDAKLRTPYFKVVISDKHGGIRRFRPDEWGGVDAAQEHASVVTTDGSIVRVKIDVPALDRQRIAPGWGDPSGWTSYSGGVRGTTLHCAVARYGSGAVKIFAVDSVTPTEVYESTSTDNGATWSAFSLAITHTQAITAIGAAGKAGASDVVVVVNNGSELTAYRWNGTSWAAGVASAASGLTANGIGVWHSGDWNVVTAGAPAAGGSRVATRMFGDGFNQASNTWSANLTLVESAAGSNVTYSRPFLSQPDTFRLTFREQFTGTGAYDRIMVTHLPSTVDFNANVWRDPAPVGVVTDPTFGLDLAAAAGANFAVTTGRKVYGMTLAAASIDVTADVIEADYNEAAMSPATSRISIENADGTYNTPAAPLEKGAEVAISPGYAGVASDGPRVWIEELEHDYDTDPPRLTLVCRSAWSVLAAARTGRSVQEAAGSGTLFTRLRKLAGYAGFELSSSGASAEMSNLAPSFAINPGDNIGEAVRRLLSRTSDILWARGEFLFVTEPLAADAVDVDYAFPETAGKHPFRRARYRDGLRATAHTRAIGGAAADVVGEDMNAAEAALYYAGPRVVADRELTTAAIALERAQAMARGLEMLAKDDRITAHVHCGLELLDHVRLSDSRRGLVNASRRVRSMALVYRRGRSAGYQQTIILEAL